jgi:hypothetical protein
MLVVIILLIVDICKKRENKEGFECTTDRGDDYKDFSESEKCVYQRSHECIYDNNECREIKDTELTFYILAFIGLILVIPISYVISCWVNINSIKYENRGTFQKVFFWGTPMCYGFISVLIIIFGFLTDWKPNILS